MTIHAIIRKFFIYAWIFVNGCKVLLKFARQIAAAIASAASSGCGGFFNPNTICTIF